MAKRARGVALVGRGMKVCRPMRDYERIGLAGHLRPCFIRSNADALGDLTSSLPDSGSSRPKRCVKCSWRCFSRYLPCAEDLFAKVSKLTPEWCLLPQTLRLFLPRLLPFPPNVRRFARRYFLLLSHLRRLLLRPSPSVEVDTRRTPCTGGPLP